MSPIFIQAAKTMNQLSRFAQPMTLMGAALLSSSALIGCEPTETQGPANHFVSDSHNDAVLKLFDNAPLVGQYVTGSSVSFSIERLNDDQRSLDELTIESSDPTLLRVSERVETEVQEGVDPTCLNCENSQETVEPRSRSQRFDVLGAGSVTMTFKDGDEVVLREEIKLVDASSLKLFRQIPTLLEAEIGSAAGEGEKVIGGKEFSLRLSAMTKKNGEETEIDIAELTELPSGEAFSMKQFNPFGMGVSLLITPVESEGQLTIPVSVGDKSIEMNFEVVSETEIAGMSVSHGLTYPAMSEENKDIGTAVAVAKDESGAPIYGAEVIWERLDADFENMVVDSYSGNELQFNYDAEGRVPFKVSIGEFSETVYLPINAEDLDSIFAGEGFGSGCDAQGELSGSALLSLLLMGMMAVRRRAVA